MVNPALLLQIQGMWKQFTNEHPKFPLFLNAVSKKGLQEDTVIEIKITAPDGEVMQTNIKVSAKDRELFESLKQIRG